MKTGDIVKVHDGSWNLFYSGNGAIGHVNGSDIFGHRFRVLLTGVQLPADLPDMQNDTMLCREMAPEQILFTQAVFCKIVSRPAKVPDKMEIAVPRGTRSVVIRMLE